MIFGSNTNELFKMFMTDAFTSAVQMVFGSALTLATFILILVVARFTSWDQFFFTFSVQIGPGSRVRFSILLVLPSVVQSAAHSSCVTIMLQAADKQVLKNAVDL